jgi:hypothetical protein
MPLIEPGGAKSRRYIGDAAHGQGKKRATGPSLVHFLAAGSGLPPAQR